MYKDVESIVPEVPITKQRPPPPVDVLEDKLGDAGQPRANRAATVDRPEGSPDRPRNRTVLQQHVDFFDRGGGIIYPLDTYTGFRKIGFNPIVSFLAMPVIHGPFSWLTQSSWLPDPWFGINTNNIHQSKHGSDSETYDTEGRMVPQKLEEFFSKHDKDNDGKMSFEEVWAATVTNANSFDLFGRAASKLEWVFTWWLLKDEQGFLSKEAVRTCIDGSIFYRLAAENEKKKADRRKRHAQ
jgi:peroxygenase